MEKNSPSQLGFLMPLSLAEAAVVSGGFDLLERTSHREPRQDSGVAGGLR